MSKKLTVHGLLGGLSLCGFSHDLPALWPKGHKWTSIEDSGKINCSKCISVAAIMIKQCEGTKAGNK